MNQHIATIEIYLESETILGGDGEIKGTVDIDIQIDEYGLPYLSARTLKGILRKKAIWYVDCLSKEKQADYKEAIYRLFGKADENDNHNSNYDAIRFSNAKLSRSLYELIETENYSSREVMNAITNVRSMTSINDETGTAKEGSLRKARTIHSGYTFLAPVYANRELSNIEKEILTIAIKLLRNIGLMRNRGKGEVSCTLNWENPREKEVTIHKEKAKDNYLYITINVEEPLKINGILRTSDSTKALSYIPGSVLRGALINAYLQDRNIEASNLNTHELFNPEKVQFWNGYLMIDGKRTIPFPQNLFETKASTKLNLSEKKIYNSFDEEQFQFIRNDSPVRIDYDTMLFETNQIIASNTKKTSSLHINLNYHENKDKNALLYRYESIASKQQFQAIVKTSINNDFIQWLSEKNNYYIWLGGARNSGYGRCNISVTVNSNNIEVPNITTPFKDELYLIATSDWIIHNELGQLVSSLDDKWLSNKLNATVKLVDQVVNNRLTGGYISHWKAYQPMIRSVKAGSIFYYKIVDGKIDEEQLHQLIEQGVGSRTNEGYGRFIALPKWEYFKLKQTTSTTSHTQKVGILKNSKLIQSELTQFQQSIWNVRTENEMLGEVDRWYSLSGPEDLKNVNKSQWSKLLEVTNQLLQSDFPLRENYLKTWRQFWSDVEKRTSNKLNLHYEKIRISIGENEKYSLEAFILEKLFVRKWGYYKANTDESLYWSLKALQIFIRKILRHQIEDGGETNNVIDSNY